MTWLRWPDSTTAVADSGGILRTAGEGVGSFLASIPPALIDFFSGVGAGAGLHSWLDWAATFIGLALLLSAFRGLRRASGHL